VVNQGKFNSCTHKHTAYFWKRIMFWHYRGLNSGPHSTTWGTPSPLALVVFQIDSHALCSGRPRPQPLCFRPLTQLGYRHMTPCPASLLGWDLKNYLPKLASNCNPPNLCLPSNWDYGQDPLCPASIAKSLGSFQLTFTTHGKFMASGSSSHNTLSKSMSARFETRVLNPRP
jgi:hypothetical protein